MNRRQARKGAAEALYNKPERSTGARRKGRQAKEPTIEGDTPRGPEDSSLYSQTGERLVAKAVPKTMASPFRSTLLKSDVKTLVTRLTGKLVFWSFDFRFGLSYGPHSLVN